MAEQIIIPNLRGSMLGYAVLSGNVFVGVGRTTPWDDEDNYYYHDYEWGDF